MLISVTEIKAQLSEHLRAVKQGEEVIITERGIPIARIVPIHDGDRWDADMRALMESGQLIPGTGSPPVQLWDLPMPADPQGGALAGLLAERQEGP